VVGLGRAFRGSPESRRRPTNIVVATGLYTYNDVPFYFHYRGPAPLDGPEFMTDMFIRDIEQGRRHRYQGRDPECATDNQGDPGVERVLGRRGRTATGVPISTHTRALGADSSSSASSEEGVDLSRVVIGTRAAPPMSTTSRNSSATAPTSAWTVWIDVYLPFEDRVDTVARMCERTRREDGAFPRRQLLLGRCRRGLCPSSCELALPAHPQRRHPALKERGVPTNSDDAGWQSPQNFRARAPAMTAPVPPIGTQFSYWPNSHPTNRRSPGRT
jgi:hypothetical protein